MPPRPAERGLLGSRHALEPGRRVPRVGREPRGIARRERGRAQPVEEDGEADGEEDRGQQHGRVLEVGLLDEDHREHDRRQATGPEPAEEGDRRPPRTGPEHRQRDGKHADDRQAENGIDDDARGEVVEHRHEHDGAEEDEGGRTEQVARLLEEERHVAADLATQAAEDRASDEGGDEPAAAHPDGQARTRAAAPATGTTWSQIESTRRRGTHTLTTATAARPATTPPMQP